MVAICVFSAEEAAGKTAVCAGLGKALAGQGKKAAFLRTSAAGDNGAAGDAAFMKAVLAMPETAESLCPPADNAAKIRTACEQVARERDAVIIEGMIGRKADDKLTRSACEVARALDARVVIVEAFGGQSAGADVYKAFGENLAGVILNKVPESQMERATAEATGRLKTAGAAFLGALPEDRTLFSLTVGQLAETVGGKILNNAEKSGNLVENFMLGALVVDSGLSYFGRKANKAAIIRGDRPDMQLAALETPTHCLVLSGSARPPVYNVLQKAENRGIPIVMTETPAADIVAGIEEALGRTRFSQEKKLARLTELMRQHVDFKALL